MTLLSGCCHDPFCGATSVCVHFECHYQACAQVTSHSTSLPAVTHSDVIHPQDNSPRKLRVAHQGLVAAAAAVSAGASRLGGRKAGAVADLPSGPDAAQAAGEQWGPGMRLDADCIWMCLPAAAAAIRE